MAEYVNPFSGMTLERKLNDCEPAAANRLTETELEYGGSITIDRTLLDAADMLPGEQLHVLTLNNASRIVTYAIEAPADSGTVLLNGPAARMGQPLGLLVLVAREVLQSGQQGETLCRSLNIVAGNAGTSPRSLKSQTTGSRMPAKSAARRQRRRSSPPSPPSPAALLQALRAARRERARFPSARKEASDSVCLHNVL